MIRYLCLIIFMKCALMGNAGAGLKSFVVDTPCIKVADTIKVEKFYVYSFVKKTLIKPFDLIDIPHIDLINFNLIQNKDSIFRLLKNPVKNIYISCNDLNYLNEFIKETKVYCFIERQNCYECWDTKNRRIFSKYKSWKWKVSIYEITKSGSLVKITMAKDLFVQKKKDSSTFIADSDQILLFAPVAQ